MLGRYLLPPLYVSYGIALTERLNVLELSYSFGDQWTIETEVGQAGEADLICTIQKQSGRRPLRAGLLISSGTSLINRAAAPAPCLELGTS